MASSPSEHRDSLERLGWDDAWDAALEASGHTDPARLVAKHRGQVVLHDGRAMPAAGVLREDPPVVGDWVAVRAWAVRAVLPRRTEIRRAGEAIVANVDLAIVMTSANRDLNDRRTERLAALARDGGAHLLMVLTKADLAADAQADAARVARAAGAECLPISAKERLGLGPLRERLLPRRTVALLGSSGVGKSTLVNALLGEERQRTAEVRSDDRGRHATVHRELFVMPNGALLIDTPGVRSPALDGDAGIAETFADIEELAQLCRFSDCGHEQEPGCAVRGVVAEERLESWRMLQREARDADLRRRRR